MNKRKIVSGITSLICFSFALLLASCAKEGFAPGEVAGVPSTEDQTPLPPPVVFAPTDISGMHSWFDASDSSTITLSGGLVSAWAAKNSPSVQFTQVTASARPALVAASINSRNTLRFDGTSDFMQAHINSAIASNLTVSFVVQMNGFNSVIPFSFNTATFNYGPDLYFYNGRLHWNVGDSGGSPFANSIYPSTSVHIYTIKNDQVNNRAELFLDGTFVGIATYRSSSIVDFSSPRLFIGNWINGTYFMDGQFAELLIYNKVLSETERETMESYLKAKWGIP